MSTNLLAVSGGSDSMYLLSHYDGIVAHFNHKMRSNSDDDAKFVWDYCQSIGRICVIGEASEKLCSEEDARNARYAFLEETAEELGCDRIMTAHTMNDNAETVLLNLIRGTGLKGLCGIPEHRGIIYRPMLGIKREEIDSFLADNNIPHVDDPTNDSDDYNRNLIRHKVIPELLKINPNLFESIYKTSKLLSQDEDYLSHAELSEHPAILSRYIRDNCPKPLSYDQVMSIINLNDGFKQIDLPGITVYKDRGNIYFGQQNVDFDVSFEEVTVNNELTKDMVCCDLIQGKLVLGHREPGDRYRPAGRNCTKTLKSIFLELDLTQSQRDAWPVLRDDAGIVWVYKSGADERVSAKPGDKAIKITVKEK